MSSVPRGWIQVVRIDGVVVLGVYRLIAQEPQRGVVDRGEVIGPIAVDPEDDRPLEDQEYGDRPQDHGRDP